MSDPNRKAQLKLNSFRCLKLNQYNQLRNVDLAFQSCKTDASKRNRDKKNQSRFIGEKAKRIAAA